MLGHITEWFYHDLAGIQYDPAAPGFQHVIIKPAFVGNITWVDASYDSVRGTIGSDWLLTNNTATINVTIPIGSTGSIYLPLLGSPTTNLVVKESCATIWQNGAVAGNSPGVAFSQVQGSGAQTYLVWTVGSGNYQFVWNLLASPTGLTASAGNGQATLNWNAVPGATGYNVKRSLTGGGGYTNVAFNLGGTNFTDAGLSDNTSYFYVVSALAGGTESGNSSEVSVIPQPPSLSSLIANPGFEVPVISTYQYNPAGGSWTFTAQSGANGSGITANKSAFNSGNPNAPEGGQVAYLQGTASISQALIGLIAGAIYQVTFSAAQRNNVYGGQAGQTWQLQLDGTPVGNYAPPQSAQSYTDYTATFTVPVGTSHTLAIVGTNTNGGDNTVFLDNVRIAFLPAVSPPHLAWQLAGLQIQFSWPADHTGWTLQVQTNSLLLGLNSNWTDVPGSALDNQFTFPVFSANGSVFFRLTYQ
jgi:hypothetical protein